MATVTVNQGYKIAGGNTRLSVAGGTVTYTVPAASFAVLTGWYVESNTSSADLTIRDAATNILYYQAVAPSSTTVTLLGGMYLAPGTTINLQASGGTNIINFMFTLFTNF